MVKLTVDLVLKNTGQIRRQRDESLQHFARRVTHAYCNEKNIDDIVSYFHHIHRLIESIILLRRAIHPK